VADAAALDPWEGVSAHVIHADHYACRADWRIERQFCPYDDLFYIWKGRGWVAIDDQRYDARGGDLFIIRREVTLEAGHDAQWPIAPLSTGFHLRRAGVDAIRHLQLPHGVRLAPVDEGPFRERFMELITLSNDPRPLAKLAAAGALMRLVSEALRLIAEAPPERLRGLNRPMPADESMARRVQAWIERHLAQPITLAALARVAKLTPTHFSTAFRKETGMSPMRYLRARRMEVARGLLATGDRTVEQVAGAVGYPDPFHFSRLFRRSTKVAPRDYRASLRHPFQS
jgi:AraC family transcriptional regulator, arabinose operon regulatory protein